MQQAVLMSTGAELTVRDLPEAVKRQTEGALPAPAPRPNAPDPAADSLLQSRADFCHAKYSSCCSLSHMRAWPGWRSWRFPRLTT